MKNAKVLNFIKNKKRKLQKEKSCATINIKRSQLQKTNEKKVKCVIKGVFWLMKTLILTCNTGQGHNSAAAAIQEVFLQNGRVCDIADTLGFLPKGTSKIVDTCFTGIYRHVPKAFDLGYANTDVQLGKLNAADTVRTLFVPAAKKLARYVTENGYTNIICVHIFAAIVVTVGVEKYGMSVKSSFLSTDYTCYPFIEKTNVEHYFLPHADLAAEFAKNGVPLDRMHNTGIPVRSAFYVTRNKTAAREALHLPQNAKIVLMMGGSMGCGPIEELVLSIVQKTDDNTRLLVSCGTNDKLLRALEKHASEKLQPFRYSDDIPQMMAAADLFITKPGGISITEAGVAALPTLLLNMVGGCETPNYQFFTEHGFAFGAADVTDAAVQCVALLADPQQLKEQAERQRTAFGKNAAQEIYNVCTNA